MELGQRLRQARLEMGLSQRQLCGDQITRNMLSQIENGSARPSMDTLTYLAARLGKPLSFFLEEDALTSPNQARMEQARSAWESGEYARAAALLQEYQSPDAAFDWEKGLLSALVYLELAEQAVADGRVPYARHLLEQAAQGSPYGALLEDRRQMLLARIDPGTEPALPALDDMLRLKAAAALRRSDAARAAACLDASQDQSSPDWLLLRGDACFALGQYRQAAEYYHRVEDAFPRQVIPKLEQCYTALEDYKMAYAYACKQKK